MLDIYFLNDSITVPFIVMNWVWAAGASFCWSLFSKGCVAPIAGCGTCG